MQIDYVRPFLVLLHANRLTNVIGSKPGSKTWGRFPCLARRAHDRGTVPVSCDRVNETKPNIKPNPWTLVFTPILLFHIPPYTYYSLIPTNNKLKVLSNKQIFLAPSEVV